MKLEPLMTYRAELKPPVDAGAGPFGTRMIFEVVGGTFEGARLKGEFLTGGGDWMLIDATATGRLDVRGTMKTDDGAIIYVQYPGVMVINEKAQAALAGGSFDFGDTYFMIQPRFETGDERYAWLNAVVAVGEGRAGAGWVEYRVYECVNG